MAKGSAQRCVLANIIVIEESDLLLNPLQRGAPNVLGHPEE